MSAIDLDDFKKQWQAQDEVVGMATDADRLRAMLESSSRLPDARRRRSILFDIVLKTMILLASLISFLLLSPGVGDVLVFLPVWVIAGFGLFSQFALLGRLPQIDPGTLSSLEIHQRLVAFDQRRGLWSTIVQASSAPLFFVVGSTAYLYARYGRLPTPAIDDVLVLLVGVVMAFVLHFVPLRWLDRHQLRYLRANLRELEGDSIDQVRVARYRRQSRWVLTVLLSALILGVMLIVAFIWSQV